MKKELVKLVILASILAVTIGLIKFLPDSGEKTKKTSIKEKNIFSIKQKDILAFILKKSPGEIEVVRDKDKWKIIKPRNLEADHSIVSRFTRDFAAIKGENIASAGKAENYGLGDPSLSIRVKLGGGKSITLYRGNMAPSGSHYYAKAGESPVIYLVSDTVFTPQGLNKSLKDFRNKDFLRLKEDQIRTVRVNSLVINKKDKSWQVAGEENNQDKQKKASELINHILNIKAIDFVEGDEDKSKLLFKDPMTIEIDSKGGTITLILARHVGKTHVKTADGSIYELSYSLFNNIQLDSEELQKKSKAGISPIQKKK